MDATNKNGSAPDHGEDRRRQILRAAMVSFARRGFHSTTMNDISAEAQISVGLIYRYFENKDAVITYMASEHRADLGEILEQARHAPTLFDALGLISVCHCDDQPVGIQTALVANLFAEAARNEQVRTLVRDVTEIFIAGVAELIAASDEAASLTSGLTPREVAEILVDSTRGMMIRAITDSSTLTAAQIRERQLARLRNLWPLLFAREPAAVSQEEGASS